MSRSFYSLAIFFLALSAVVGLFESVIRFQLDVRMTFLQSYANWFLIMNAIHFIESLFLLKYYHHKNFRFTFFAGTVFMVVSLGLFILVYIMLILVARELTNYYIFTLFVYLAAGFVYAVSLVFSRAGNRPWLKVAGVVMLLVSIATASALIGNMLIPTIQMQDVFIKIMQWTLLVTSLVPLLFIMNFRSEQKMAADNVDSSLWKTLNTAMTVAAPLAVLFTLIFGHKVATESYWAIDWNKKSQEAARALAKPFEARTYVDNKGDTLHYLFMKPLDYDPQNKYPLVVCLHGGPTRPRGVEVTEPAPLLSKYENRKKYPAFLFVPQGPPGILWGGIPNVPGIDSLVFEAMQSLEEEFEIDEKRRYVAGISGGGYGSWYFIGTRPEMFAAAIPICGSGNPALAPNMVDVAVWAFHGSLDRNVPVRGSRAMIEAIKKAGGNPRYTEFPDAGHNVWPQVNETPGLLDWIFAQKRD